MALGTLTDYPRELYENVLAHKLPDEVEAANFFENVKL